MEWQKLLHRIYSWFTVSAPKILAGLILLIIGLWLIRLLKKWVGLYFSKRKVSSSVTPFLSSLITVVFQIILVLVVMQMVGVQMTVFAALVGAMGVAFGLALSGTLQNFTSGILILLLKPYRTGDNIIAQGQEGTVTAIQLFHTMMLTRDNKVVIIPNSKLSNELIINMSKAGKRRLDVEMKFNFGVDFRQAQQAMTNALQDNAMFHLLDKNTPGISGIDPDGYKVVVYFWVEWDDYDQLRLQIQQQLIDAVKMAGIKLPGM